MSRPIMQSTSNETALQSISAGLSSERKSLAGVLFTRALARTGLSQKEAAFYMGLSESQLSRQIAGTENLSLQRTMQMPVTFWVEFLAQLAEHYGIAVATVDRKKVALANAIGALATLQACLEHER